MADFSQLKRFEVAEDASAWFVIPEVGGARIKVRTATLHNRGFHNAQLTRAGVRDFEGMDLAQRDAALREEDVALFASHVLCGWEDVRDKSGALVEFSVSAALDLLRALAQYCPSRFDQLRYFARDADNFRGPSNVEGALGNLSGASAGK